MTITLRPYQDNAVRALFNYFEYYAGNPLVELPTGTGKTIVNAKFCKDAYAKFPHTRMMILSHVKELLQQNYDKIREIAPEVPVGLYSAGLKRRDTIFPFTVAGIQSVYKKANLFGLVHILAIDEAHLLGPNDDTMYRRFIDDLLKYNPKLRIYGLTATPFRLKGGMLTHGENALFTKICYREEINYFLGDNPEGRQYLARLRSKVSRTNVDLSKVKTIGGDYRQDELEKAFDDFEVTRKALDETFELSQDRRSWLVFCSGIKHAEHVRDEIRKRGKICECVTQKTSDEDRERILNAFKKGEIQVVTNYGVLTTGFDAPIIDNIVLLRATKSLSLYIQMLGRGMRLNGATIEESMANNKHDCQVLDYGHNLERFGPINCIDVKNSNPTTKPCPQCLEINPGYARFCVACEYEFYAAPKPRCCPQCEAQIPPAIDVCIASKHQCLPCGFQDFYFYVTTDKDSKKVRCPQCDAGGVNIIHFWDETCGYEFEGNKPKIFEQASDAEIIADMKKGVVEEEVKYIFYTRHKKAGAPDSLKVEYRCGSMASKKYVEFIPLEKTGAARNFSIRWWRDRTGSDCWVPETVEEALKRVEELKEPQIIRVRKNGDWWNVVGTKGVKNVPKKDYLVKSSPIPAAV